METRKPNLCRRLENSSKPTVRRSYQLYQKWRMFLKTHPRLRWLRNLWRGLKWLLRLFRLHPALRPLIPLLPLSRLIPIDRLIPFSELFPLKRLLR